MIWWQWVLSLARFGQATPRASQLAQPSQSSQSGQRIIEQINPAYMSSSPIQEDWYWSRYTNGAEEDFWYRRLSDVAFIKDVIPSTYLEIHNACYEAYNANPLAFAIIELSTSFVLGEGITVSANDKRVQQVIDAFWYNPREPDGRTCL